MREVTNLKSFFLFALFFGAASALYYLYERQLGAISFFILSVFFFKIAFNQLSNRPNETETDQSLTNKDFNNEKNERNRR